MALTAASERLEVAERGTHRSAAGPFWQTPHPGPREQVQFIVEGGRRLSGTIRPSGNKNAALPIVAAALLTDQPVTLNNVPRIRDLETLVDLVRTTGAEIAWTGQNQLRIHAREVRATALDAAMCARIRASILLAAPLLARCGRVELAPPGGDFSHRSAD